MFMYGKVKKKFTLFRKIFFSSSEKLTCKKENVISLNIFKNFNLFFCQFRSYKRSELQVHGICMTVFQSIKCVRTNKIQCDFNLSHIEMKY